MILKCSWKRHKYGNKEYRYHISDKDLADPPGIEPPAVILRSFAISGW
jgi:hypothetical protein